MSTDVIVMGGGIAGLGAAAELARRGARVVVLEARRRLGGRILTVHGDGWPEPVELGAEFVHGGNHELWKLVRRASAHRRRIPMRHWWSRALLQVDAPTRIGRVTKAILPRARGSFADHLRRIEHGLQPLDRLLASGFIEGFDAAPLHDISARSVSGQTLEPSGQYRLSEGQDALVLELAREIRERGGVVRLGSRVESIEWRAGSVAVTLRGRNAPQRARAAIVTLPLGVLQSGNVSFRPGLGAPHARAIRGLRMGHVARVVMRFDARRWKALLPEPLRDLAAAGFGFLHSSEPEFPTWWSLSGAPVVTGWAGGPAASRVLRRGGLLRAARASLADRLGVPRAALARALRGEAVHDWSADPFTLGAYTYIPPGADAAPEALARPLKGTLFFAGEATADAEELGTVHGALRSGLRAAREALHALT